MSEGLSRIREYYDSLLLYLLHDRVALNARHAEIERFVEEFVPRGAAALELGCGIGISSERIRKRARRVLAVDLSPRLIDYARASVRDVEFLTGDVVSMRLDERFDVICMFDALEHIPSDRRNSLWETLDLHLSPAGRILLTIPHPSATADDEVSRPGALQIVDEAIPIDVLLHEARAWNLVPRHLRAYGIDRDPQYVSLVLERIHPPVARKWPKFAYAKDRLRVAWFSRRFLRIANATIPEVEVTKKTLEEHHRVFPGGSSNEA